MAPQDTGYDAPPPNNRLKFVGAAFGLIIAPIIAGIVANIGSFFVQKKLEGPSASPPTAAVPQPPAPQALVGNPGPTTGTAPATSSLSDNGRPVNLNFQKALADLHSLPVIHLFNGRDLAGFYTYLGPPQPEQKAIGKNKDPDQVFSAKNGVLAISGKEMGALTTNDEYENYLLTVEYQWGTKTYGNRANAPKFGAVVFHAFGADGARRGAWLQGYRARVDEKGGGDLGIIAGASADPHISVEVEPHVVTTVKNVERTNYTYKPGGTIHEVVPGSHILRLGTINNLARHTPGTPAGTVWEKPSGEWNTLEILCIGDTVGIVLNGTLVNAGNKASHTKGKIQLHTERADLFFRTVDLRTIPRGYPTLPGMPKMSNHGPIAKANTGPTPSRAADTTTHAKGTGSAKNTGQARATRNAQRAEEMNSVACLKDEHDCNARLIERVAVEHNAPCRKPNAFARCDR